MLRSLKLHRTTLRLALFPTVLLCTALGLAATVHGDITAPDKQDRPGITAQDKAIAADRLSPESSNAAPTGSATYQISWWRTTLVSGSPDTNTSASWYQYRERNLLVGFHSSQQYRVMRALLRFELEPQYEQHIPSNAVVTQAYLRLQQCPKAMLIPMTISVYSMLGHGITVRLRGAT